MKIFISYSHNDRGYVKKLYETLQAQGIDAWFDDLIEPGSQWEASIARNLSQADTVLFVVTPNSLQSPTIQSEMETARESGKRILPLLLKGAPLDLLPPERYVDVRGGKLPPAKFFEELASTGTKGLHPPRHEWESAYLSETATRISQFKEVVDDILSNRRVLSMPGMRLATRQNLVDMLAELRQIEGDISNFTHPQSREIRSAFQRVIGEIGDAIPLLKGFRIGEETAGHKLDLLLQGASASLAYVMSLLPGDRTVGVPKPKKPKKRR